MSYKKLTINIVLDDIFAIAKVRSLNTASHIKDTVGNTQEQQLAITDAERPLWDILVKEPADKVYNYLIQAGKIKEGSYKYNITPVAFNDAAGVVTATTTTIAAAYNDSVPSGATYSLVGTLGGASHAETVTINSSTGDITYKSVANYAGSDKVNYQVTDENGIVSVATIYIQVGPTAIAPTLPPTSNIIEYGLYMSSEWDTNLTQGLVNLIQKAIVSGGLFEWYKSSAQYDLAQVLQQEYTTALQDAKKNINSRLYRINRPHVTF